MNTVAQGDYFVPEDTLQLEALLDRCIAVHDGDDDACLIMANAVQCNRLFGKDALAERKRALQGYREKLEHLMTLPTCEQRSEEWYNMRQTMITASDFAQAVGKGKFGTREELINKKVSNTTSFAKPTYCAPLVWGVMFESVAADIYAHRYRCKLHEFGLVKHHSIGFLGASPDSITDQGIMLEIKAPFKRKITGKIPMQYYYQIQGQLEVCDLEECDYLECKFESMSQDAWQGMSSNDEVCGIIVEMKTLPSLDSTYVYSDMKLSRHDQLNWLEEEVLRKESVSSNSRVHRMIFWRLQEIFVCRVKRSRDFWSYLFPKLEEVWDLVTKYRNDPTLFEREVMVAETTADATTFTARTIKSRASKQRLEDVIGSLKNTYGFTQV